MLSPLDPAVVVTEQESLPYHSRIHRRRAAAARSGEPRVKPPGHEVKVEVQGPDGEMMVLVLQRALYGSKQAGALWRKRLDAWLRDYGFEHTMLDECVVLYQYCSPRVQQMMITWCHDDAWPMTASPHEAAAAAHRLRARVLRKADGDGGGVKTAGFWPE